MVRIRNDRVVADRRFVTVEITIDGLDAVKSPPPAWQPDRLRITYTCFEGRWRPVEYAAIEGPVIGGPGTVTDSVWPGGRLWLLVERLAAEYHPARTEPRQVLAEEAGPV